MSDNVNHPKHYNIPGRKECIVEMLEKFGVEAVITFCTLNAYKYRYRCELKNGQEDLNKAEWYDNYASKLKEQEEDETDNNMKVYEVHYISGRTERYSVTRVKAVNKEEAVSKVFEMEGEAFENRLVLTKIIEEVE